ncbi:TrkH family potassium uptake protein [Thioclava sp. FR2]|uniref:TrkH family potassium uptake protein n=1 Tax=Thioclava sp. FR2 TaxID=3445780 RepID=UPI003EBB7FFB
MLRDRLLTTPLLVTLSGLAGLSMFVPAAHASLTRQHQMAQAFFYSGILVLILTLMVAIATASWRPQNIARSQLASLVGAYALIPVIFTLPITQVMPDTSFVNAWFEMVSSFTTTGATVYDVSGRLPTTVHLWRALVGWMGGLFILVTATAILAPMNLGGVEVLSGRTPGRGSDGLTQITRIADPSQRFLKYTVGLFPVYFGLTLALWLLLMIAGEVNLTALIHAMATLSTSGIGTGGDLTVLNSGLLGEAFIFVFLGLAISRRFLPETTLVAANVPLRQDPEIRLAVVLIVGVTSILFLRHWIGSLEVMAEQDWSAALRGLWGSLFTVMSFLTTTGFESGEWDAARSWSGLSNPGLILAGLAMFGGGVATTAGGVKLLRVYVLARHGERELEKLIHPSSVGGGGGQARQLRRQGAYFAWLFFMLFALSIAVTMAVLSLLGLDFEGALVLTLAALTTTGQLADLAASNPIQYVDLSSEAKVVLAAVMILGRLETLAILALMAPSSWRH